MQNKKDKLLIYGLYTKLLSSEKHYGSLQTKYRLISSTWLLATFAAIGFLFSFEKSLPMDHLLAAVFVCILGIFGQLFLWYEDNIVQEILLDLHVIESLKLEKKNPWLSQIHHRFLHLYKFGTTPIVKGIFFIGCISLLLLIISICLFFYFCKINHLFGYVSLVSCFIIDIILVKIMLIFIKNINKFLEKLPL